MKEETKKRIWKVLGVVALIATFSFIFGAVSYDYGRNEGIKYERGTSLLEPVDGHMYQITIIAVPVTSGQKNGYYKVLAKKEPGNLSYALRDALNKSIIVGKLVIYNKNEFKEAKID